MKLLCTDLDGTLFYPKRIKTCICKKNVEFLQDWIDAGNKVALVSSRSADFTQRLKKEIGRSVDFINCTSAQIYIDDKLVKNDIMDNSSLKKILDYIDKEYKPMAFLITSEKWPILINDNGRVSKTLQALYKIYWHFLYSYREKYLISNEEFYNELDNGKIYKVMIFFGFKKNKSKITKDLNKKLRDEFPEIEASWVGPVNELTPKDCNKGAGVRFYTEYLGIDKNDVYVVGDSGNDISMFMEFHENSYCMMHAYPSVKKYAKYQISHVYDLRRVLKGEKNE